MVRHRRITCKPQIWVPWWGSGRSDSSWLHALALPMYSLPIRPHTWTNSRPEPNSCGGPVCCSKQSRRRGVLSSSLFPSLSTSSFNGSNCVEKRGSPGSKAWSTLVPCHAELQSDGEPMLSSRVMENGRRRDEVLDGKKTTKERLCVLWNDLGTRFRKISVLMCVWRCVPALRGQEARQGMLTAKKSRQGWRYLCDMYVEDLLLREIDRKRKKDRTLRVKKI